MTKEISLTTGFSPHAFSFENLCVCSELIACIQAIWNRISLCLSGCAELLYSLTASKALPPVRTQSPLVHTHLMRFLRPEEVAMCERVCKSWQVGDTVWKWQCRQEQVSYSLPDGQHKKAFSDPVPPASAFGPEQWKEYLHVELDPVDLDPKTRARLPARIHRQAVQFKETRRLLLIPGAIGGKPFCYETFAPIAERAGMRLDIPPPILEAFGKQSTGASLWVWVEILIKEESQGKTYEEAQRDYPGEIGRSLWYSVMIVADYARYQICRFPVAQRAKPTCVWTADENRRWNWVMQVGDSDRSGFNLSYNLAPQCHSIGVAAAVPAQVLKAN